MPDLTQIGVLVGAAILGAYVFGELKAKQRNHYIHFLLVATVAYLSTSVVLSALSLSSFTLYGVFSTELVRAMILGAAARASARMI